ncbi:unnamed protein product [Jaminaea pallidilutea]
MSAKTTSLNGTPKPQPVVAGKPNAASTGSISRNKFSNATWHLQPKEQWSWQERMLDALHILQDPAGSERPPVFPMDAPVPVCTIWSQHAWVAPRAFAPLLVHYAFVNYTGIQVPATVAGPLYLGYFLWYGSELFSLFRRMTKRYGTFDGAHPRDGIPDDETSHVSYELTCVVLLRAIFAFTVIYPSDQSQLLNLTNLAWMPINLFLYSAILDFWFYWYHRLMHDVDFLWRFHKKHHTTKHPTAAHGAFADTTQEAMDILGIPLLTYLTTAATPFRVDFATWWVSCLYTLFLESGGHSGIRAYLTNPVAWPLTFFDCDLVVEDHDLHHRQGWKDTAANFGKQTRLWDTIFGTTRDRIEGHKANLDHNQRIVVG